VYFHDPIPAGQGYVLQNLNATMYGRFYCNTTHAAVNILVLLQDAMVTMFELPTYPAGCGCPNCVVSQTFSSYWNVPDGWPDYKYNFNNALTFQIATDFRAVICLSSVVVTLTYGRVSYSVTSLHPSTGPSTGGTNIFVEGNGYYSNDELFCRFDNVRVPATYINKTYMNCTSPTAPANKFPANITVEVSEDGYAYTYNKISFLYTYKKMDTTAMMWVWIAIAVCVASVIFVAAAGYMYARKHTAASRVTYINEKSKLMDSEKYKNYGQVHPINISEITILQRIGRGSCAEVFMGVWRGTTVAIKKAKVFTDDDEEFFTELSQEALIMSSLRHPNVLQFLGTASNPPEIVIVMEYMSRGSLYRIIHDKAVDLPWPRVRSMALDIARGMNYLHCSDPIVIHRDLKSHNLLVDEYFKVKVCDFGLSTVVKRHLDRSTAMTPVGTPCWTAPEVLRNERYTEKADVFSFGVVLWELVTREDPYQGMATFQIVIEVGQHKMRPIIPSAVFPPLAQLAAECWNENPALRPAFADIVHRLEKMAP